MWADTKELTFDLSTNPGEWPTANSTTLTEYTYTLNEVNYTFALKNVKCNSGYLMLTQPAALGLPAISGYKLTKVVATNSSGCSTSTKVGISSSSTAGDYVTGGEIQTWSTVSSNYTYNLSSTSANTMYYLYVTNKNAQLVTLKLTYEAASSSETPCATPTFSPDGGKYTEAKSVSISTTTEGASIYYTMTTDGTEPAAPTESDTKYTNPISVTVSGTQIKAKAFKTGMTASPVASATYTIFTVSDGVFDFVGAGGVVDYGSGVPMSSGDYVTEDKTWTAGQVTMVTSGKYRWWSADNTLRFYANTPNSAMKFSVPDGYVITKIVLTGGQTFEAEGYSSGTWKGAQQSVTLSYTAESGSANVKTATVYYSEPTISVTMGSEGYMTYCNQNAALSFGDLEAYVVSAVGDNNVTLTQITQAPANTPVVLKGSAGSHNLTVLESASAVETNKLYRSNGTAANNDSRNVYALAKKGDPAVVGFYKLKDGVKVPEGKCYLSVNKSSSAPEFFGLVGDGNTTGMNDVRNKMAEGRGEFYNLNGQRVAQPTKGLYIVNGRKVVIK